MSSLCSQCEEGRRICSNCGGTGSLTTRLLFLFKRDAACPGCGGVGLAEVLRLPQRRCGDQVHLYSRSRKDQVS